jgi:hypothetical protein
MDEYDPANDDPMKRRSRRPGTSRCRRRAERIRPQPLGPIVESPDQARGVRHLVLALEPMSRDVTDDAPKRPPTAALESGLRLLLGRGAVAVLGRRSHTYATSYAVEIATCRTARRRTLLLLQYGKSRLSRRTDSGAAQITRQRSIAASSPRLDYRTFLQSTGAPGVGGDMNEPLVHSSS